MSSIENLNIGEARVRLQPYEYNDRAMLTKSSESNLHSLIQKSELLRTYLGNDKTRGIIFPYTPSFTFTSAANYNSYQTTHSNYPVLSYVNSAVQPFTLQAPFTCLTVEESRYSLACLHFLRIVTKSRFGINDEFRGAPPPLLRFSAYGNQILKNVPVVVTNFTMIFSDDVDYTFVLFEDFANAASSNNQGSITEYLPVQYTLQIEIAPQYLPTKQYKEFDIVEYTKGNLISDGFV